MGTVLDILILACILVSVSYTHLLQLGDGAHPPASQQRVLNVQYRAPPGHQRPDDRNGAEGDTILPRKIHQKNVYHKNQQSQNLQGVDGNGIYDGLAAVSYTHLDVYKRQGPKRTIAGKKKATK